MDTAIELIVCWVEKNLKNPKLYLLIAVSIIILVLVFPYIDANFFFYNRIEKRIGILQSLSELDMEKISQSYDLQKEYCAILSEVEGQREWSISGASIINRSTVTKTTLLFKFLSGSLLAWIIAIIVPFINTFKNKKEKIASFFLCAAIGAILGMIGYIMPIIFNQWVNYIGFPVFQLFFLIALSNKDKKN